MYRSFFILFFFYDYHPTKKAEKFWPDTSVALAASFYDLCIRITLHNSMNSINKMVYQHII